MALMDVSVTGISVTVNETFSLQLPLQLTDLIYYEIIAKK